MFDAFDSIFKGDDLTGSVSRKCDDGKTRTIKLENPPRGDGIEDFAKAAAAGSKASKKWKDDGLTLSKSVPVTGVKATNAVNGLRDSVIAKQSIPPAVRKRGESVPEGAGTAS